MFKKWFGGDPAERLQKARRLLGEGEAVRALEIAEKVAARGGDLAGSAQALVLEAREGVVRSALEKAEAAEREGNLHDAADWIEAAMARMEEPSRRQELEARRDALLRRAEEREAAEYGDWHAPEPSAEVDPEHVYEALVEGLAPVWATHFRDRPPEFRSAWVALNEGRAEEAVEHFDRLQGEAPHDPVARLERGRCRLMLGDPRGAQEDLEEVWPQIGSEPLDLAGHLSVPGLWAEATLEVGEPERVVERLEPLAGPEVDSAVLPVLYGQALLATGALERAMDYLAQAASIRPRQPELPFLLAQAELAGGEPKAALETLEIAVAPSCTAGRCGAPPRHPPSLRLLATLHLEHGRGSERARELMAWVLRDQGGLVTPADQAILERLEEA